MTLHTGFISALYGSNCVIGSETGDGNVCQHELNALKAVTNVRLVLDREKLSRYNPQNDVWLQDLSALAWIKDSGIKFRLAHFYGGPYFATFEYLATQGTKLVVTMPAHKRKLSIEEHERWYGTYPFIHVKDDSLFQVYTRHVALAGVVIAPSTNSRQAIIEDMGVSSEKIVIVPHGCDVPQKVEPIPEKFQVLFLSQAGADKGIPYLVQAWGKLAYSDAELVFVGAGTDHLDGVIKALAVAGKFRLLGRVEDVNKVYSEASVLVLPSVNEGFGITALEAMAHGRPVIVAGGAGSHDVVRNGQDGFIVPIRDPEAIAEKIDWLKNNPDRLREMGKEARRTARKYSWDKIEKHYQEVYASTCYE